MEIKEIKVEGFEKVIEAIDKKNGLYSFIAIHNTSLGPALGGTRIFPYKNREEALEDALRLAKGMTKKSALAGVGFGGGKSVIIADPNKEKTVDLLHSFGHVLNYLNGLYIAAEDVGSSVLDMGIIKTVSPFVAALADEQSSGDPSPYTAWGVYRGILASAMKIWGSPSVKGKIVALQGLGHVGYKLAEFLFWNGATLIVSDLDEAKVHLVERLYSAKSIKPSEIYSSECDIFSPCAMGGIINKNTIPLLKCKIIAGAANNQLFENEDESLLIQKKILYAPDFIINAGGIINASKEFSLRGYCAKEAREHVDKIYDILLDVYDRADRESKTTHLIAEEMAEENLKNRFHARKEKINF